eukprot:50304-Amphidinium_carterae.1
MEQEQTTHAADDHPGRGRTIHRHDASAATIPSNHIDPLDITDAVGLPIPDEAEIDMIPIMPPTADPERSRSREGPRHIHSQPELDPTTATSPAATAGCPSPASRPASVASTLDYPDQEAVPLPVHVPPADDDDDDDADDRAAAAPSTPRAVNNSAKRSASAEDSPTKKSKKEDDNDAYFDEKDKHFMSSDELYTGFDDMSFETHIIDVDKIHCTGNELQDFDKTY